MAASEKTRAIHRFVQCILLILVLPLLPPGLEWFLTGTVTSESITLVASMYAITIGVSSKYKTLLAFAIIVRILFTAAYGSLAKERADHVAAAQTIKRAQPSQQDNQVVPADPPTNETNRSLGTSEDFGNRMRRYSIIAIVMVFLVHAGERFLRHVVEREPFWDLV
jgi:hypothetical protein